MIIYVGADHRGYEQKAIVIEWLRERGLEYVDMGAASLEPEDDFNEYADLVAEKVARDDDARGILICGSGHGVCMQANRYAGVRAVLGVTPELAAMGRKHEDANVLCLGADFVPDPSAVLTAFFETEFSGDEKYVRRNSKLDNNACECEGCECSGTRREA